MPEENEHVIRLREIAEKMKHPPFESDIVAGEMVIEFAQLVIRVSNQLDETQHRVRRLNIWLVILTVALVASPIIERLLR